MASLLDELVVQFNTRADLSGLKKFQKRMDSTMRNVQKYARRGAIGVLGIGTAGVKVFLELDKTYQSLAIVSKLTDEQLEIYQKRMKEIARETSTSQSAVVSALSQTVGLYQTINDEQERQLKIQEGVLIASQLESVLAKSGVAETAAPLVEFLSRTFDIDDLSKIGDKLLETYSLSGIKDPAKFFLMVRKSAASMGLAGEDFDGAMTKIAFISQEAASRGKAISGLDQVIERLAGFDPATNQKIIESLGLNDISEWKKLVKNDGIEAAAKLLLSQLGEAATNEILGSAQVVMTLSRLTAQENQAQLQDILAKISGSGGTLDAAAARMSATVGDQLGGAMEELNQLLQFIGSKIAPHIKTATRAFKRFFDWIANLPEPIKKLISDITPFAIGLLLLGAVLIPVIAVAKALLVVFGPLKWAFMGLKIAFKPAIARIKSISAIFSRLIKPATVATAATGAIGKAFAKLAALATSPLGKWLIKIAAILLFLVNPFKKISLAFKGLRFIFAHVKKAAAKLRKSFVALGAGLSNVAKNVVDQVRKHFMKIFDVVLWFSGGFERIFLSLKNISGKVSGFFSNFFGGTKPLENNNIENTNTTNIFPAGIEDTIPNFNFEDVEVKKEFPLINVANSLPAAAPPGMHAVKQTENISIGDINIEMVDGDAQDIAQNVRQEIRKEIATQHRNTAESFAHDVVR